MGKISYRLLTKDDVEVLDKFLREMSEELFDFKGEPDTKAFIQTHFYPNIGRGVYLFLDDDKPIGFISAFVTDHCGLREKTVVLDFVYVLKEYRNKKEVTFKILDRMQYFQVTTGLDIEVVEASYATQKFFKRFDKKTIGTANIYQGKEFNDYVNKFI